VPEPTDPPESNADRIRDEILKARPAHVSDQPDQKSEEEQAALETDREHEHVRSMRQDTAERKLYASRIFFVLVTWLAFIVVVILIDGFQFRGFHLGDPVVISLIAGTATGILGLIAIVARYLFPGNPRR
jgi:hypothetical protein